MVLKREAAFYGIIILFCVAVSVGAFFNGFVDPLTYTTRLLGLNGYIALSVAAILSAFLKEVTLFFKKSFTKIHHYFAAAGLLLVTLLPIVTAIQTMNPAYYIPNFSSVTTFFYYGGIIALILLYLGFAGALLRKKIAKHWRPFHGLVYLALFVGVIHANVIGIDFQNITYQVIFDGLFAAVLVAFGLKRWQTYRLKARIKAAEQAKAAVKG